MKITGNTRSKDVNQGFTLVEILLVVAIIGILAALVIPNVINRRGDAAIKKAYADVNGGFKTSLGMYAVDTGSFPKTLQELVQSPADVKNWKGPYIDLTAVPTDPWGHAYVYIFPGRRNASGYDLYSMGPDGQDGTSDDIGNWPTVASQ
jgi:general secretion pathway protein G